MTQDSQITIATVFHRYRTTVLTVHLNKLHQTKPDSWGKTNCPLYRSILSASKQKVSNETESRKKEMRNLESLTEKESYDNSDTATY